MFPAAHSFFGVVTHTYLASTSSGLNVVATSRPNIGLKVATLRPMFRFGKVTHTYLASKSPGLNVAWPQRRLASMSPGLNVAWPQRRWPQSRLASMSHRDLTFMDVYSDFAQSKEFVVDLHFKLFASFKDFCYSQC